MQKIGKKHQKTLKNVFKDPIKSNVKWVNIENMLIALGAELSKGSGSRIRIYLNNIRAVFHRPHPIKETDKGALKLMRRFLKEAGAKIL